MTRAGVRLRLVYALKALIVVSLLAVVFLLVRASQQHRLVEARHLVDLSRWTVLERPSWSTTEDVHAVRDASGLPGHGLPLYDRRSAESVRDALEAAPGVRRVLALRRRPPDRVEAVLELRVPVAAVLVDAGQAPRVGLHPRVVLDPRVVLGPRAVLAAAPTWRYVEVDDEGVVLGPAREQRPVRRGVALRVISGADGVDATPGGDGGADVRVGVSLCRALDGHRDGLGATVLRTFDEVDVTNLAGRVDAREPEVLLRAAVPSSDAARRTGCVVEWGRVRGDPDEGGAGGGGAPSFGEPTFTQKASRLAQAVRIFGDFSGIARVRVAYGELSVLPADGPEGAWLPALAEQSFGR